MKKSQKSCDFEIEDIPKRSITIKSQSFELYRQQLIQLSPQRISSLKKDLNCEGITYHNEHTTFEDKVVKASEDSLIFLVRYGNFQASISVLFSIANFENIQNYELKSGSSGKIQIYELTQDYTSGVVIKKFDLRDIQNNLSLKFLKRLLKEVLFFKVASALKVGPKFCQNFAYDLIIQGESAFFLMEYCAIQNLVWEPRFEDQTKSMLSILHAFKFVHNDIKPANMGWSSLLKKLIFLDFGLSEFICEDPGYKTLSGFKGSFYYSGKQMKAAYYLESPIPIDLYYNDLYCLQKTIDFFKKKKTQSYNMQKEGVSSSMKGFENYFRLKYQLFFESFPKIKQLVQEEKHLLNSFKYTILNSTLPKDHNKNILVSSIEASIQLSISKKSKSELDGCESKDDILCSYLIRNSEFKECSIFMNVSYENLTILHKQQKITKIWKDERWMKKLFDFLFVEFPSKIDFSVHEAVSKSLIEFENGGESNETPEQIYLFLLTKFKDYFFLSQQIQELEIIYTIYRHLFFYQQAFETSTTILSIVSANSPDQDFLNFLLSFLEQKLLLQEWHESWQQFLVKDLQRYQKGKFSTLCIQIIQEILILQKMVEHKNCLSLQRYLNLIHQLFQAIHQSKIEAETLKTTLKLFPYHYIFQKSKTKLEPIQIKGEIFKDSSYEGMQFIRMNSLNLLRINILHLYQSHDTEFKGINKLCQTILNLMTIDQILLKFKSLWNYVLVQKNCESTALPILIQFFLCLKAASSKEAIRHLIFFLNYFYPSLKSQECLLAFSDLMQNFNLKLITGEDEEFWAEEEIEFIENCFILKRQLMVYCKEAVKHADILIDRIFEVFRKKVNKFPKFILYLHDIHYSNTKSEIIEALRGFHAIQNREVFLAPFYFCFSLRLRNRELRTKEVQEMIWEQFRDLPSIKYCYIALNIQLVAQIVLKMFRANKLYKEGFKFLLKLGNNSNQLWLQPIYPHHKNKIETYSYIVSQVDPNCILHFAKQIAETQIQAVTNSRLAPYILIQLLTKCKKKLELGIQKRLIVLLCFGIRLIKGHKQKQEIRHTILRWHRKNKTNQKSRSKRINLKEEGRSSVNSKGFEKWISATKKQISDGCLKVMKKLVRARIFDVMKNIEKQLTINIS